MASTTFRSGRGRRRQGAGWLLLPLLVAVFLGLMFLAATGAYRLAASKYAAEAERLRVDMRALQESNRQLHERTAAAEQRGAMSVARAAQVERDRASGLPKGDAARLLGLVEKSLADGVPADRLAFVITHATPSPTCNDKLETKRIQPRTPLSTSNAVTAGFVDGKVVVAAQAASARDAAGELQPGFDPAQPVELRFTAVGGGVESARGPLPLGHAFLFADSELRFLARASEKAPGSIDVSLQTCSYP